MNNQNTEVIPAVYIQMLENQWATGISYSEESGDITLLYNTNNANTKTNSAS